MPASARRGARPPGEVGGERDEAGVVRPSPAPRGARPVRAGQAHRRGAARAGPRRRDQARLEREPPRPVAEGGRGGRRRGGRRQPLPRPAGDGAAGGPRRAPRRAGVPRPRRQRLGRDHRPDRPRLPRPRRQRRHLRARLRPLPADRDRPQPRGAARARCATGRTTSRRWRRAIDARTRLVFVANPNNPTGTWNRRAEVEALVAALPPGCLLVLDEAYFEYADDPDYPNGDRPRPPRGAGDRDPHLLEGVRARGAARRLRGRGACGARGRCS